MLHRQKALLAILQQVGGQASTSQMINWAFLLRQETPSYGEENFYQFIPYHSRIYSFTLNHETEKLIRNGFLERADEEILKLTPLGVEEAINLPKQLFQNIKAVTGQYRNLSDSDLIDKTYAHHYYLTTDSDFTGQCREHRSVTEKAIYTAGYEGKSVDKFLNLLMKSGIQRLIDVRYNPVSRRYGFHKSTLKRLCSHLDIDYQHLPALGIPGSSRKDLNSTGNYLSLFNEYRCGLVDRGEDLQMIMSLLQSKPSVLICMEANPEYCHRNVLAQHLVGIMNLQIRHLGDYG